MEAERLFSVGELAKKCGVTVRTLQYYDQNGLLTPSRHSEGGRRLYRIDDLLRLQQILFYKSFGFSLDEIRNRLMTIESAQDFAEILERQKEIVKRQIQYLTETVALMDKTVEEIHHNGDIPIHMVISILSATKQDQFFALVMKSVGHEKLKNLMQVAESHDDGPTENAWTDLFLRLKNLHQNGVDPVGPEGECLASDWWDQVMFLTGGNPELIASVLQAAGDMSSWPEEAGDAKKAIEEFLSPALGNYFIKKGVMPPGMEE